MPRIDVRSVSGGLWRVFRDGEPISVRFDTRAKARAYLKTAKALQAEFDLSKPQGATEPLCVKPQEKEESPDVK